MTRPRSLSSRRRRSGPRQVARVAAVTGCLLLASCGGGESCRETPVADLDCADLLFKGRSYVEWREVVAPAVRQELGDATYPACNTAGTCADKGLDGHGATDVWLAEGVDPTDAVLGFREGTRTVVLFVERGTDPGTVADDLDPALLG